MDNITLGQIYQMMAWGIGLVGATITIVKSVQKVIKSAFEPIETKIDKVDKNATMNYIVARMDEIDKGNKLDGVAKMRFVEQYEHYTKDLKGNTYIHDEYERLKREGKL